MRCPYSHLSHIYAKVWEGMEVRVRNVLGRKHLLRTVGLAVKRPKVARGKPAKSYHLKEVMIVFRVEKMAYNCMKLKQEGFIFAYFTRDGIVQIKNHFRVSHS